MLVHESVHTISGGWAAVFPGQGALPHQLPLDATTLMEHAARVLGADFYSQPDIRTSAWVQVVTLCIGVGRCWRLAKAFGCPPRVVSGHSLGEISAYVVAGALSLDQAISLVALRGQYMDECSRLRPGTMVAVKGSTLEELQQLCAAQVDTVVANENSSTQLVVSGPAEEVSAVVKALKPECQVVTLPVLGAFHSPVMAPAQKSLLAALQEVEWTEPSIPVVSSVDGSVLSSATACHRRLAVQLQAPVRWTAAMRTLRFLRPSHLIDVGPGTVMASLLRTEFVTEGPIVSPMISDFSTWTEAACLQYGKVLRSQQVARCLLEARCAPARVRFADVNQLFRELHDACQVQAPDGELVTQARAARDAILRLKEG